jgi:hypothetical protein
MSEVSKQLPSEPGSVSENFYEQSPFTPIIDLVAEKHNGLFVPSLRILVSKLIRAEAATELKAGKEPTFDLLVKDLKDPRWLQLQRKNWFKGGFKSASVPEHMHANYCQALTSLNDELSGYPLWMTYVHQFGMHYRTDGSVIPNRAHLTENTPLYESWIETKLGRTLSLSGLAEVLPEGYVSRSVVKATNPRNPQHSGRNPRTGIKIIEDYS